MSLPDLPATTTVRVTRSVDAPPERIFDTWMSPKSPGSPWFGVEFATIAPTVGGLFHHRVQHEGRWWPHYGRFLRLDRPTCIEHTWVSPATLGLESIVRLDLDADDGATQVTLTHDGLPDNAMGRQHADGWGFVLAAIAQRFAR